MKMTSSKLRLIAQMWVCMFVAGTGFNAALAADDGDRKEPSREALQLQLEEAQRRLDTAAREVAELSMSLSNDAMPHVMFGAHGPHRAALGINIRHGERDDGIEVISVSPGGAAAKANLKAGDLLVEVNGESLERADGRAPHEKLMAILAGVAPDEKVTVRYRRDGKLRDAQLVAQPLVRRGFTMAMRAVPGQPLLPHIAFTRAEGVFGSAEFVPMTPKLGQYFGTDQGLLVVRAPADTRLKLEEGDVLLDIDGRTPSSPSHALRILSSYQDGETLKLNLLRAKKRMTFDITIPEGAEGSGRFLQRHHFAPTHVAPGREPPRILLKHRDPEAGFGL